MKAPVNSPSPLCQRMIDDMRMRKLAPKTQSAYLLHVRRLLHPVRKLRQRRRDGRQNLLHVDDREQVAVQPGHGIHP